ncbi:hypothetical protein DFP72DRAFT_856677 [Ephemerocybe angulata]|uniref:Protein kinase domain-containing protein n=1 Tax=Ephemerocybe angulata TaxID=980116 RepID=A0A8H6HDY4_9AGAR|nr:hypothetical protein DFP72DRAFT_856677 [Tulosesus angulatus]
MEGIHSCEPWPVASHLPHTGDKDKDLRPWGFITAPDIDQAWENAKVLWKKVESPTWLDKGAMLNTEANLCPWIAHVLNETMTVLWTTFMPGDTPALTQTPADTPNNPDTPANTPTVDMDIPFRWQAQSTMVAKTVVDLALVDNPQAPIPEEDASEGVMPKTTTTQRPTSWEPTRASVETTRYAMGSQTRKTLFVGGPEMFSLWKWAGEVYKRPADRHLALPQAAIARGRVEVTPLSPPAASDKHTMFLRLLRVLTLFNIDILRKINSDFDKAVAKEYIDAAMPDPEFLIGTPNRSPPQYHILTSIFRVLSQTRVLAFTILGHSAVLRTLHSLIIDQTHYVLHTSLPRYLSIDISSEALYLQTNSAAVFLFPRLGLCIKEYLSEEDYSVERRCLQELQGLDRIPILYGYGFAENRQAHFIITSYLGGPTNEPEPAAWQGLLDNVLTPVHLKGWHHHDIRPDNVVARPDGALCLVDFGYATDSCALEGLSIAKDRKNMLPGGRRQGVWFGVNCVKRKRGRDAPGRVGLIVLSDMPQAWNATGPQRVNKSLTYKGAQMAWEKAHLEKYRDERMDSMPEDILGVILQAALENNPTIWARLRLGGVARAWRQTVATNSVLWHSVFMGGRREEGDMVNSPESKLRRDGHGRCRWNWHGVVEELVAWRYIVILDIGQVTTDEVGILGSASIPSLVQLSLELVNGPVMSDGGRFAGAPRLTNVFVCGAAIAGFRLGLPWEQLNSLKLEGPQHSVEGQGLTAMTIPKLTSLKGLSVSGTENFVKTILSRTLGGGLTSLFLSGPVLATVDVENGWIQTMPQVRCFGLASETAIPDWVASTLLRALPEVGNLQVLGNARQDNVAVALANGVMPGLKSIRIGEGTLCGLWLTAFGIRRERGLQIEALVLVGNVQQMRDPRLWGIGWMARCIAGSGEVQLEAASDRAHGWHSKRSNAWGERWGLCR